MKRKSFFKRMNRGLVLGVVLLVGLIIYVNVDSANFKKEAPVIEQTLTQYMEDSAKLAILPEEYQKLDVKVPQAIVDQTRQAGEAVFNKYWVSSKDKNYFGTKEMMLERYQTVLDMNAGGDGYITKWSAKLTGTPRITKNGPRDAIVTLQYTQEVEFVGAPAINTAIGMIYPDEYTHSDMEDGEDPDRAKLKRLTSYSDNLTLEMTKVDGVWKIVKVGNMWMNNGSAEIVE